MSKRCKGDHHHVKTEGGVIKSAAIYSKRLVAAILGGLSKTLSGFNKSYSLLKNDNSVPNVATEKGIGCRILELAE